MKGVALIGLRRSGKSTIGRLLAARLHAPFVDTDLAIEERTGRTPRRWIEGTGLDAFRDLEAAEVARATATPGRVVACGGGAPLRADSARRLRAYGVVLYLRVDPWTLNDRARTEAREVAAERPALVDGPKSLEAFALFAERDAVYAAVADGIVDAASDPASVVGRCVRRIRETEAVRP